MQKDRWKPILEGCESMHSELTKVTTVMQKDALKHQQMRNAEEPTDTWKTNILVADVESSLHNVPEYHLLVEKLNDIAYYEPTPINCLLPDDKTKRYRYLKKLKEKGLYLSENSRVVLYARCFGNNLENLYYLWKVETEPEYNIDRQRDAQKQCEIQAPVYHSRFMKRKFMETAEAIDIDCSQAKLRRLYVMATSDASASRSAEEKDIDKRVMDFIELGDESIICDLRKLNHRPNHYNEFFDAAAKYIDNEVEISVDDRRQDQVVHLARAMSARDLLE